jgi:hypothetical protein
MTFADALNQVVAETGHERYRWLCSDANPDVNKRIGYQALVMRKAGVPGPLPAMPITVDYGDPAPVRKGGCCG